MIEKLKHFLELLRTKESKTKYASNFERRRAIQHAVCLIQIMGVDIGYNDFNLYVVGVFSKKLSSDLHQLEREGYFETEPKKEGD